MSLSFHRRRYLSATATGALGLALRSISSEQLAAAPLARLGTQRLLVLWMNGGPSQLETLDPKPGSEQGGPTKSIATTADGVRIGEHLPKLARQLHHVALLRNLSSPEGAHERAQYLLRGDAGDLLHAAIPDQYLVIDAHRAHAYGQLVQGFPIVSPQVVEVRRQPGKARLRPVQLALDQVDILRGAAQPCLEGDAAFDDAVGHRGSE